MTFESNKFFEMHDVLNKLRSIEASGSIVEADPGMETGGKELTDANFSRTMARMNSLKGAVTPEKFELLRSGIKSMYANHKPNSAQLSALMDLLETILAYVADDATLYNRLRSDIKGDITIQDKPKVASNVQDDTEDTEDEVEEPIDSIVTDTPRELKK